MIVFVIVYTESTDASFAKLRVAHSFTEAQAIIKSSFYESLESYTEDYLYSSYISQDYSSAFFENKDGMVAHWGIHEIEI